MERGRFRRQAETTDAQLVPTRPSGAVGRVPGFVGNPAAGPVGEINPSATLFQNLGSLGVEPLSVFLVTFCTSKKLPHGVWAHSLFAKTGGKTYPPPERATLLRSGGHPPHPGRAAGT